jgi:hypothetical protein
MLGLEIASSLRSSQENGSIATHSQGRGSRCRGHLARDSKAGRLRHERRIAQAIFFPTPAAKRLNDSQ